MPTYSPQFSRPWESEKIEFANVSTLELEYTSARRQKHGSHPMIDVWLQGEDGVLFLAEIQPVLNYNNSESLVSIEFSFGGPSSGMIVLN